MEKEVNIPKDLDECFVELKKLLKPEDIEEIRNRNNKEELSWFHHGLGSRLRNSWKLWSRSVLSKWFEEKGISHPDDMSGIIIFTFWKHLNSEPIELEEQIDYYQGFWKKNK